MPAMFQKQFSTEAWIRRCGDEIHTSDTIVQLKQGKMVKGYCVKIKESQESEQSRNQKIKQIVKVMGRNIK